MNQMNSHNAPKKSLPNYYLTLDILPGSSQNEIHHAYKRAKMTYSNGSLAAYSLLEEENNEKVLEEIETAYAILSNPSHRREYDIKMGFSTWVDESQEDSRGHHKGLNRPSILSPSQEDKGFENPFDSISYDSKSSLAVSPASEFKKSHVSVVATPLVDVMHFEANPEFDDRIRNCDKLDGAFLRAVRIYKQVSLDQLANRSKLSAARIHAIEEEDLGSLYTQAVYLRGHVAILCRELNIPNGENLAKGYVDRLRSEGKLPKQTL
jgi:hypothetical protein